MSTHKTSFLTCGGMLLLIWFLSPPFLHTPSATATESVRDILPDKTTRALVTGVVDGDTIHVRIGITNATVRLIGIDTPEVFDPRKPVQCYGREASARTKALVDQQTIFLQSDATQGDRDKYGRLLRYVWLADGTDNNLLLIHGGSPSSIPMQSHISFSNPTKAHREMHGLRSVASGHHRCVPASSRRQTRAQLAKL